MAIEPLERRRYESQDPTDLSPPAKSEPASGIREQLVEPAYAEAPDYLAFYAGFGKITATTIDAPPPVPSVDDRRRDAVDRVADAYAGPYVVGDKQVRAPVMFRMGAVDNASQSERGKLAGVVGKDLATLAQAGSATPDVIRRATQKLIDAGKLPTGTADVAVRIKQMQWKYSIGIDCACFTHQAIRESSGKTDTQLGLHAIEDFRRLDSNRSFGKVAPRDVRPGDIITLDATPPEVYGHNVIVRSGHTADAFDGMPGAGPFRVIEVDSSWGAGAQGSATGGYRRDTWVFDESSKQWGFHRPGQSALVVSSTGPSDLDTYHGAYRVKA